MTTGITSRLSGLIKDPELEKLNLTLAKPNIFEILRIAQKEIRHTNFLAWILNPNQSHNIADTFLKWFLKDVFSDNRVKDLDEFKVDSLDTRNLLVYREYKNIDLLLEGSDFIVVVENKLWSGEHSNQLKKYKVIIENDFPDKKPAYVFLTPYAESPRQKDDSDVYVAYGYQSIVRILDIIVNTYGESLSEKVITYIRDYTDIIRRYIMQDDNATDIAREIYKNHKEALDFIFEMKNDRNSEISAIFNDAVREQGFILGSSSKGYCRFLTKNLDNVLPKSSKPGWKNSESFAFEINIKNNKVNLKCVVSPGEDRLRNCLISALMKVKGGNKPYGQQWSTVHNHPWNLKLQDKKYSDDTVLKSEIIKYLESEHTFIADIEQAILAEYSEFIKE